MTIVFLSTSLGGHRAYAEEHNDSALIKLMGDAKVRLEDGLEAASSEGRPISAKFEVENGKLQLSVYTTKGGKFSEVLVDYTTGKVSKIAEITEGDDLSAAKSQNEAMGNATIDLKAAAIISASQIAGARVVSIAPSLKGGGAVASITLLDGPQFKTVQQTLF
jgi:hypothetical protein